MGRTSNSVAYDLGVSHRSKECRPAKMEQHPKRSRSVESPGRAKLIFTGEYVEDAERVDVATF